MPAKTNNFNVESLKGQAVRKQLWYVLVYTYSGLRWFSYTFHVLAQWNKHRRDSPQSCPSNQTRQSGWKGLSRTRNQGAGGHWWAELQRSLPPLCRWEKVLQGQPWLQLMVDQAQTEASFLTWNLFNHIHVPPRILFKASSNHHFNCFTSPPGTRPRQWRKSLARSCTTLC